MTTSSQIFTEATDPDVMTPREAAGVLSDAPWHRFGVFGDSLSLGVGDATPGYDGAGWPVRVEQALRRIHPDLDYLNTAVVGVTTERALREQKARMDDFAPDLLHLGSGANDIMRREPDWGRIEDDLRAMYEWAAATGAQSSVFTLGNAFVVPAFPDFTDRVARLNDITRMLADEHGTVVAECWNHPVNERPNLLSADRIHFAAVGQAVISSIMVRALGERLVSLRSQRHC
ncbi:SGNH/GDSL hydrolase family protein [Tsukamurella sp. 8F]|uniref:SGNH/GDSL hydrolase family protein n=1 Tax=unclassified Tsukamurella TaxID=2633480 RepID=UPI0023BA3AED|nr:MULTISPECIES: SGNH/GDSL hydrolase family protein [unclassified Tsukamurella]MDF0528388.1 SGNH/GDSL hydrolase family protein [Tsukamurella sp. 8J]MDF0586213.1 SGNH/GDSL hydrolase family protein [Tsukamurella sp. 8F]